MQHPQPGIPSSQKPRKRLRWLWITVLLPLLAFVLATCLLALPVVQGYLLRKGTAWFSSHTGGELRIQRLDLRLPWYIALYGVSLRHPDGSELAYAGHVEAELGWRKLFTKKVCIDRVGIHDLRVQLWADSSGWNYGFITRAFAGEDTTTDTVPTTWDVQLGPTYLQQVLFAYADRTSGDSLHLNARTLQLSWEHFSTLGNAYLADRLRAEDTKVYYQSGSGTGSTTPPQSETLPTADTGSPPKVGLRHLALHAFTLSYTAPGAMRLHLAFPQLRFEADTIDLNRDRYHLRSLMAEGARVAVRMAPSDPNAPPTDYNDLFSPVHASLGEVHLSDLHVLIAQAPEAGSDSTRLALRNIVLKASAVQAHPTAYSASVGRLALGYNDLPDVIAIRSDVLLTPSEAALQRTDLRMGPTAISFDVGVTYRDLHTLVSQGNFLRGVFQLHQAELHPRTFRELYAFAAIPTGKHYVPAKPVALSAHFSGSHTAIDIHSIKLRSGGTSLSANGASAGPEWSAHALDLRQLDLHLAKADLLPFLPATVDPTYIPPYARLEARLQASPKRTHALATLATTDGTLALQYEGGGYKSASMHGSGYLHTDGYRLERYTEGVPAQLCFGLDFESPNLTAPELQYTALLNVQEAQYDHTLLSNLRLSARGMGEQHRFSLALADSHAVLNAHGTLHLSDSLMSIETTLYAKALDLYHLGLTEQDLRMRATVDASFELGKHHQKGSVKARDLLLVVDNDRSDLPPIASSWFLGTDSTAIQVESEPITMALQATMSLDSIGTALVNYLKGDQVIPGDAHRYISAKLDLRDIGPYLPLLPAALEALEPCTARVEYRALNAGLHAEAHMPLLTYGGVSVDGFSLQADGAEGYTTARLHINRISTDSTAVEHLSITVTPATEGSLYRLAIGPDDAPAYRLGTEVMWIADDAAWRIKPENDWILNQKPWSVDTAAAIYLTQSGYSIAHFDARREDKRIFLEKQPGLSPLHIAAEQFELGIVSGIFAGSDALVTGQLSGAIALNPDGTFTGDGAIAHLAFLGTELGRFTWGASAREGVYNLAMKLTGPDAEIEARGVLIPEADDKSAVDVQVDLPYFNFSMLEGLLPGLVQGASGTLSGGLHLGGTTKEPILSGNVYFDRARLRLRNNSALYAIPEGEIRIEPGRVVFPNLAVRDSANHTLTLSGHVAHRFFTSLVYDLRVQSESFTLLHLQPGDNPYLEGRLIVDSDMRITGPEQAPRISSFVSLRQGSHIHYIIPEEEYSDFGTPDLVEWVDFNAATPGSDILTRRRSDPAPTQAPPTTIDLSGFLQIDPSTEVRIVIDPIAGDFLAIKGGGKLGLSYDKAGRINLNGTYELSEGEYLMTFYNLASRRFLIEKGSRITWNGDPYSADLDLKAVYRARTTLASLLGSQASTAGNEALRRQVAWDVVMSIKGALEAPEIGFEIRIDPDQRGILGGVVDGRLAQINANETELNRQVFALLILNTFISEGGSTQDGSYLLANQARNSASQILTQQLNQLSDKLIAGVELTFDLQSYGGQTGQGETDLNIDLSKSLFNDRVTVRVGSTVPLENSNANAATGNQQLMTNLVVEYKITPDGRYRFKAFSRTDLEDIVVGRINRTGAGVLFRREFDKRSEVFRKPEEKASAK